MVYPETFTGFRVTDTKNWSTFEKQDFAPKKFDSHDIDVRIEACGVCGSDVHTITGGWGEVPLPLCVGHEVIGTAIKVGPDVKTIKVGDRVGVGAQVWACLECEACKSDNENYCPKQVDTYGAPYPEGTVAAGYITQGGYASHIRAHEYFTFPIPKDIPTEMAAPMMCAGLTVYSPLVRHGIGPGKKVAILGIGGLGHFAILWAKALGAEVWALSHTAGKEADAKSLGVDHFVLTSEKNWADPLAFTFDLILNSADKTNEFDLSEYMSTLNVGGSFHNVGLPDEPLPQFHAKAFMARGSNMGGSHIGCRTECLAMLKLASERKIKPMIETIDISAQGCKEAVERVNSNDVRYRFALVNFAKAFPEQQ